MHRTDRTAEDSDHSNVLEKLHQMPPDPMAIRRILYRPHESLENEEIDEWKVVVRAVIQLGEAGQLCETVSPWRLRCSEAPPPDFPPVVCSQ